MAKPSDYLASIDAFTETEDCTLIDLMVENPRCVDIAKRFGTTPLQVALDINHRFRKP